MTVLPLTTGLAVSAMIRANHAMFAPEGAPGDPFGMGTVADRVRSTLPHVLELYDQAVAGHCPDKQVAEEFEGKTGFYREHMEEGYAEIIAAHPEAAAILADTLAGRST